MIHTVCDKRFKKNERCEKKSFKIETSIQFQIIIMKKKIRLKVFSIVQLQQSNPLSNGDIFGRICAFNTPVSR